MRIRPLKDSEVGLLDRVLFAFMQWRDGEVAKPLRVYARKPGLMRAFLTLGARIRGKGKLPERLKRLAMHWTARRVGCPL